MNKYIKASILCFSLGMSTQALAEVSFKDIVNIYKNGADWNDFKKLPIKWGKNCSSAPDDEFFLCSNTKITNFGQVEMTLIGARTFVSSVELNLDFSHSSENKYKFEPTTQFLNSSLPVGFKAKEINIKCDSIQYSAFKISNNEKPLLLYIESFSNSSGGGNNIMLKEYTSGDEEQLPCIEVENG